MKCSIDQTEMEKGWLGSSGNAWIKEGLRSGLVRVGTNVLGAQTVYAFKCPKCGKVELTTKDE